MANNQADHDLGMNTEALVAQTGGGTMALWSEDKKKDFVKTFQDRANAARFILWHTAYQMTHIARDRHFISTKHQGKLEQTTCPEADVSNRNQCGGRSTNELAKLARDRAEKILSELPAIKDAVKVIRPDVAKWMDERDELLKKGQKTADALDEVSGEVSLADVDQKMTIAEFRKNMKDRAKAKRRLVAELDEIGREGTQLESQIHKALYAGLPGVTDAVVKVINQHYERVTAFEQTGRRVEEKVLFGDSQEALSILQTFEKDEVHVSDEIRAEFKTALGALQLAGKKARR